LETFILINNIISLTFVFTLFFLTNTNYEILYIFFIIHHKYYLLMLNYISQILLYVTKIINTKYYFKILNIILINYK